MLDREVRRKLTVLRHADEVTGNVAMTCRYFGMFDLELLSCLTVLLLKIRLSSMASMTFSPRGANRIEVSSAQPAT